MSSGASFTVNVEWISYAHRLMSFSEPDIYNSDVSVNN